MNLYYNRNNDDECDNSISSQKHQNLQKYGCNTICRKVPQQATKTQTNSSSSSCKQNGQIIQKNIITMSNASCNTITKLNNTCPKIIINDRQQQQQQKHDQQQHQQQQQHIQLLQKWRQRPRGQLHYALEYQHKPVIWNLLNINKLFKIQTNLCKYFLVMFVVILTSFPAANVMASTSLQQETNLTTLTNTNSPSSLSPQHDEYYKNDKIATISQSVNSTSNYNINYNNISNYNNNNDNDTTKNSAVKIILNDYNDAFSQMLPLTEQQQQQEKTQHDTVDIKNNLLEMEPNVEILHDELLDSFRGTHSLPRQPMYTNEFAVHIPAGKEMADLIANKYGFINMGQVSLKGLNLDLNYLFNSNLKRGNIY